MESTLSKVQKESKEWRERNFPHYSTEQMLLGVVEEVGELAHSHLKQSQNIRNNEDHVSKAKDAVGDILIYMLGYCSLRDFNIEEILQETWDEVKQRDWVKFPNNGRTE